MSFPVARKLICSSGTLLRTGSRLAVSAARSQTAIQSRYAPQTFSNWTRSLGHMCRRPEEKQNKVNSVIKTVTCSIHTTGDKELSDFLSEEISIEKKTQRSVPASVKGFEVVSSNGADVDIQRKHENETITIRLNVNGTVDDDIPYDDPRKEDADVKMVSKPPFIVEINKGGDVSVALQCSFPGPDDTMDAQPDDQQQQYEDLIEIQEVALLKKGAKWEESTYCVQGSILDGNLYDMLLSMLEERGIDGQFIDQLIDYSTAYEHSKYISFLEGLKDFANAK